MHSLKGTKVIENVFDENSVRCRSAENVLREAVQRADVLLVRFRFVETPDGHSQLHLGDGPEERVDRVNDSLRLLVALLADATEPGVERDAADG